MEALYENLLHIEWQQIVMWVIGGLLIFLAIKKNMEPTLLLPMGFGAILVNLPLSGVVDRYFMNGDPIAVEEGKKLLEAGVEGVTYEPGIIEELFNMGIANELFPLLLFIGIGAMIDFGPLLTNPKLLIFGAAAQ